MAKSHTRKVRSSTKKSRTPVMGLKKLRAAFDTMERFVEALRPKAKHSFSDAVSEYREQWHRVFKREISPADAAAYLKFRFGMKGKKAMTRRQRMRGGSHPIAGAPLDYSLRAGVDGPYGQFPSYQSEGLDRYYGSALTADCGKANGFPTDGSSASQKGGGIMDSLFRPIAAGSPMPMGYVPMMEFKGVKPFPTADPVGPAPTRTAPATYISNANTQPYTRSALTDIYRTKAS
uniref:Uncharacterized protein n=1 Tax=viral metagenome TaxID=1070528 RepID=A0A6C0K4M2_9ZZZZ